MSLYRRKGSEMWWMNIYRGPGRKRLQRSTRKKNRVEAELIERAFMSANKGATTREKMLQIVEMMYEGEEQGLALEELGEWYRAALADEGGKLSKKELDARVNLCGRLSEWCKTETRAHTVNDISVAVAWQFSKMLGEAGVTSKSRNAYLSSLGTVWKMLEKRSEVRKNVWAKVRVQRDRDEEQHGRAFTPEEEKRIYKTAEEVGHDWLGACLIARYTGLRMKDVVNMTWAQIEDGWIYATPAKTKKHDIKVGVPIHRELKRWLDRAKLGHQDSDYILPERQKHGPGNKYYRGDMSFADLLKKAKVSDKDPNVLLSFHCWRHTFDTRLAEAGVDQDTRMAMTGHTVKATETIYNHDQTRFEKAIAAMA